MTTPPTDPLVRKEPPLDWYRTPSEAGPRVETADRLPDLDPDIALWPVTPMQRWPFTGSPAEGIWPKGWTGVDNTGTTWVCTVGGQPGTWAQVGGGGSGITSWGQESTAKFAGSGSPSGVVTPSHKGDLYVDDTTPALYQATGVANTDWQVVGGGGSAGASIVRAFPFAFDTPNILTGAALYTPTVGDILLDAWIEIDTAWDGTTPLGDFGQFSTQFGLYHNLGLGVLDMTLADAPNSGSTGLLISGGSTSSLSELQAVWAVTNTLNVPAIPLVPSPQLFLVTAADPGISQSGRFWPSKVIVADPIKICVSQDGTNTGADPGSTVGAAVLYLVTATPA